MHRNLASAIYWTGQYRVSVHLCRIMMEQYHIMIRIYYVGNTETGPKGMVQLSLFLPGDQMKSLPCSERWWQPRTVALEGRRHRIPTELLGHVLLLRYFFWPTNDCKQGQYSSAWWFQPTPLKNDGVKVSWDDEIPNCFWKVIIQPCSKAPPTSHIPVVVGL